MGMLRVHLDAASTSLGLALNPSLLSLVQQSPRILRIIVGELPRQLLGAQVHKKFECMLSGSRKTNVGPISASRTPEFDTPCSSR